MNVNELIAAAKRVLDREICEAKERYSVAIISIDVVKTLCGESTRKAPRYVKGSGKVGEVWSRIKALGGKEFRSREIRADGDLSANIWPAIQSFARVGKIELVRRDPGGRGPGRHINVWREVIPAEPQEAIK